MLEFGIENKVNDVDNLYFRSYSNCTTYDKVFKQTFMLKRRAYYEFLLQGNIIGNNINVFSNEENSFSGAIVGDPLLNDYAGVKLFGHNSMYVFDNVIDEDFSAMYPHITVAFNIERNTMIGKLIIPGFETEQYDHIFVNNTVYDNSSDDNDEDDDETEEPECLKKYDAGRDFIECYLTGDVNTIGSRWFNLPSYDKLYNEFTEEFKIPKRKRIRFSSIIDTVKSAFNIKI